MKYAPCDDHEVLIRLGLADLFVRIERARRSVSVWNIAVIAFGGLLWLWLRAPSFNLLPGAIRAVLTVVNFLGYGLTGIANSSVTNVAGYVNLGYGIIFGPIFLFFIALGWLGAEKRLEGLRFAAIAHPSLRDVDPSQRSPRSLGVVAFLVTAVVITGSTVASIGRYFSLQGHEANFLCEKETEPSCKPHENYWAAPWPDAERSVTSWLRFSAGRDWCVEPVGNWLPGFRGVVRDSYFTRQIEHLPKYVCSSGDIKPHLEKIVHEPARLDVVDSESIKGIAGMLFHEVVDDDPYRLFPYFYPLINLPLLVIFGVGQIAILVRVARLRGYRLRSPSF
jgi:hypothetical protein